LRIQHRGRLHVRAACQFEDQFTIEELPAKMRSKLADQLGSPTPIFAGNGDYTNRSQFRRSSPSSYVQ
jgi:hypothetical protein